MGTLQQHVKTATESLREWVITLRIGTISVRDASVTFEPNSFGEETVFLHLTLSDPIPGAETWPLEDVLELHDVIDDKAIQLELALPWHVRLHPEHPEEPDEQFLSEREQ